LQVISVVSFKNVLVGHTEQQMLHNGWYI